jgi:hypothetical protein
MDSKLGRLQRLMARLRYRETILRRAGVPASDPRRAAAYRRLMKANRAYNDTTAHSPAVGGGE